jgi:CheY-like chemotaxis protein
MGMNSECAMHARKSMTAGPTGQAARTRARLIPATDDPIVRAMLGLDPFSDRGERPVTSIARPPRVRVAIADDDPLARMAIQAMVMRCCGLTLVGAASGVQEIVEVASAERAEAIVLDWMMPEGGGAEAARRILGRHPAIRIIALTASHSDDAAQEMLRAGAFSVLHKGGSAQQLERTIHQALETAM